MADYTLKYTGEQLDDAIEKANSAFLSLDNKLNKDDVYDGLDSEDASKALSARQGKLLKNWIEDNCITYNKDIDLGEYSLTTKNFTFKKRLYASNKENSSESNNPEIFLGYKAIVIDDVYARLSPFNLAFSTPNDYTDFYIDRIERFGTEIYFPHNPDPNGIPANAEVFALRSDIPSIDDHFSPTSTNAVQNKVINSTISELSYQLAMVRENLFQTVLSEIDYTEDFATLYPIPDTFSDTDGTHRVLFSETQLREVEGNSFAYNQLSSNGNVEETVNGITFTNNKNGTYTVNGTATADVINRISTIVIPKNHRYLLKGCPRGGSFSTYYLRNDNRLSEARVDIGEGNMDTWLYDFTFALQIVVKSGTVCNNLVFIPQLFDLTLMGIDSVSTVEEAKSELLKRGIDIDQYNPYSEGEIRNTTASGVKVNGYNLLNLERMEGDTTGWERENTAKRSFDETKYYVGITANNWYSPTVVKDYSVTGNSVMVRASSGGYGIGFPIRVFPGKTYQVEFTATDGTNSYRVGWYDKEGSQISFDLGENKNKVAPANAYWGLLILSPTTTNTDVTFSNICFHLSTLRTGYAPYKEPKAISFASTELLGAGEAHDTIEVVEGDKVAGIQRYNLVQVKRVGTVDLGTLAWDYSPTPKRFSSDSMMNRIKIHTNYSKISNLVCSKYKVCSQYTIEQVESTDKAVAIGGNGYSVNIKDTSYTDATAFKTAMNGVILNYELATPTRTTIAENLTFEEVSATIEQGGSIESVYETLAPNCTTGFVVKKTKE